MVKLPDKSKDVKFLLLKKLNHGDDNRFAIQKRRKGKDVLAVVSYELHNRNYVLGSFKLYSPKMEFSEHKVVSLDGLDSIIITVARNKFLKHFNEIKFQKENDLL